MEYRQPWQELLAFRRPGCLGDAGIDGQTLPVYHQDMLLEAKLGLLAFFLFRTAGIQDR